MVGGGLGVPALLLGGRVEERSLLQALAVLFHIGAHESPKDLSGSTVLQLASLDELATKRVIDPDPKPSFAHGATWMHSVFTMDTHRGFSQ